MSQTPKDSNEIVNFYALGLDRCCGDAGSGSGADGSGGDGSRGADDGNRQHVT